MNNGFDRRYRLLKTDDFSSVFAFRRCRSNAYFQVFWGKNDLDHPRLGLVVAKKVAKKAHERNYMKRTIREWFRCHKNQLDHVDFIVRSKQKFEVAHRDEAIVALSSLFKR